MFTQNHDLIIRVPLPNVDVEERRLYAIKAQFRQNGKEIKIQPEDEFPIAPSWAELVIAGSSFFGGIIVSHYAEMLLDAFDAFMKKKIDQLSLTIRSGDASVYRDVPLRERAKAIQELEEALTELKIYSEKHDAMIYWPAKTEKKENGDLWIYTSVRNGSSLKIIKPDQPEYALWTWVIGQVERKRYVTGDIIDGLVENYKKNKEK